MRNVTAEQIELALQAANELESMASQICTPLKSKMRTRLQNQALAIRQVVEMFRTMEAAFIEQDRAHHGQEQQEQDFRGSCQ